MPKVRVHQLAKELNIPSQKIMDHLAKRGIAVKNHFAALDESVVDQLRRMARRDDERAKAREASRTAPAAQPPTATVTKARPAARERPAPRVRPAEKAPAPAAVAEKPRRKVELPEGATVKEFAEAIGRHPSDVIKMLIKLGEMVTVNQPVSREALEVLAEDMALELDITDVGTEQEEEFVDDEGALEPRPAVVTVMGHVDHGKTSLLDAIRETDVISGEAGGITQHIGAYQVDHGGKKVTFIDTPGHEAFTAMRARGASVTDIAVLVVAADDGVMPQTVEAIDHARAANVPIIVAINKIDKPDANPDKVKQELTEYQLVPEAWGGDTVFVEVSAKQRLNIDDLLDMILLVAELRELKANPETSARGVAIECKLDKGRGPVATVLVQRGTLNVGDAVVIGTAYGRVRALLDDHGKRLKLATPAQPVEIVGLSAVPSAGDSFRVVADDKEGRRIAEERAFKRRLVEQARTRVSLDDLFKSIQEGQMQDLNLVIKADTQGSVEALRESLGKLIQDEVRINVIHRAVGPISESDVMLAAASNAIIIGYNVRPEPKATEMAGKEEVDIRTYRVIYKIVEDINAARLGMLAPRYEEVDTGRAEVRETFKVPKLGVIAGCYVTDGEITRDALVRLVRDGIVQYEGKIGSLRRFKDDVKSVKNGYECGIGIENYQDIKEGDVLEAYEKVEVSLEERERAGE